MPSDDDAGEPRQNFASHAARVLPPIAESLVAQLDVGEDPVRVRAIGDALARAFMAGAHAGQVEVVAQVIEQSPNVTVEHRVVGAPDEPPG